MQRISKRSPTLVFLDTAGIDPKWSTVARLREWQVEFLINFPLGMSINRNPDSDKTRAYFGSSDFIPLLRKRGTGKARDLLDLYKKQLASLGFVHTTEDDRLVKTQNGKRLYYLVFVGKHPAGQTIMNAVFRQPDARGQGRLGI
jgi:three-Cys-motif partner protein